jgi:hypothetical protein
MTVQGRPRCLPTAAAALSAAGLAVASFLLGWPSWLEWPLATSAGTLALVTGLRVLLQPRVGALLLAWLHSPAWQWGTLLGLGPLLAVALALALSPTAEQPFPDPSVRQAHLPGWRPAPISAATDRGSPVRLYTTPAPPSLEALREAEADLLGRWGLSRKVISTAGLDTSYNCHGWVFAAGRYLIDSEGVDLILADNAYLEVAEPRSGDLVVYRDIAGSVQHTGLVRATASGGLVLVESKWAWMGRYLHPAGSVHYRLSRTYYRSARRGHTLRGLGEASPALAVRQ